MENSNLFQHFSQAKSIKNKLLGKQTFINNIKNTDIYDKIFYITILVKRLTYIGIHMKRLKNKNVLITGAASGIGRAAAIRIAQEGANVALIDIDFIKLQALALELRHYESKILYEKCDVSNPIETKTVIDKLCREMGGIQSLSHNAGILRCYNTHEMTSEQWDEIIAVNLTGTFNVNKCALPYLLENETSFLVNNSSIADDQPHPWMAAYSASKGAIKSFTRSLFIEYCLQGLRANCVLPGGVDSELSAKFQVPVGANPELKKYLSPLGKNKLVSPEYIAGVIALLVSDDAFHINGTEIYVDGGRL
jgi:NAD(P)-dependent dehydrogenase (short-subunit alcohol dehydrogenase family)